MSTTCNNSALPAALSCARRADAVLACSRCATFAPIRAGARRVGCANAPRPCARSGVPPPRTPRLASRRELGGRLGPTPGACSRARS